VADETGPSTKDGSGRSTELGTGRSTNGTGPSTELGTGWREKELEKTGTGGQVIRKRPVMARVAEQLRLIK
jgi:hypothetical protein